MPGGIMTNLQRHLTEDQLRALGAVDTQGRPLDVPPGWKTPQQGAATSVLLAASPLAHGVSGRYFEDCDEAVVAREGGDGMSGVAPYALDPVNATGYARRHPLASGERPCRSGTSGLGRAGQTISAGL
jgi:hypothetical protein